LLFGQEFLVERREKDEEEQQQQQRKKNVNATIICFQPLTKRGS